MCLNNFNGVERLLSIFPQSNDFEFTSKRVFRRKKTKICSCGIKIVHNGFNYVRKKCFGNAKIGKEICPNCKRQHISDRTFWQKLLSDWNNISTDFISILRNSGVSWGNVQNIFQYLVPCCKTKAINLFNKNIEMFEFPQDNYVIINYDEQHPKCGRFQKYRLTLLNYETKIPIAEGLFDDKENGTIEQFLRDNLDTEKEIVIITDCDKRYPNIFKKIWGIKVKHQKCILHLNKMITKTVPRKSTIMQEFYKYCLLDIFYDRNKELKFLETLKKNDKLKNKESVKKFREYVKSLENERRREHQNHKQRSLIDAKNKFDLLCSPIIYMNLTKKLQEMLKMIKRNWKYFTAFYTIKGCPTTNNAVENYYSTSMKQQKKKQFRSNDGIFNHMKLAALKKVHNLTKPKTTFLEMFELIRMVTT